MYVSPLFLLRFRQTKKLRCTQMESNIHPQISLVLLNLVSFYNLYNIFVDKCLKMKLLILDMHSFMHNFRSLCRVDLP